ncbi:transcription termination/antitermination protein NusA [Treponema parvum]|uniref:Transcription termination/antitermination protein NusA n=1 Tax=Treponema parvum TaxID=138851 RepID=A0A975F0F1_9SPIR|nr:transcription termination factor NusA [Treponema parvum]QTQ12137.1 transcription termination/antitermination protein NusA [Treponema parvum]
MASEMAEAIRQLTQEKGISEESVKLTIENMLKAAYKRTYGTSDNAVVKFADDMSDVAIYSRKTIVDGVYDPVMEMELEEALKLSPECEVGDEIDILEDPKKFDRSAVATGKQTAHQALSESFKDNLYNEYKTKIGEIIIGYYQREHNGNIYVDLGKVEGILPGKYQSPREKYEKNDRIKALIVDLKRTATGLQLVLSRSDPEFVRSIVELEVPEVYDKTVEIYKVVRDAGYRTKIAVYSNREDVDPVGACVGLKGVRIQNVIRELYGEKIDILKYDADPTVFIKNALSPAEVDRVLILDEGKKQALAIVQDSQFSLAIGKQGQNVRLANRLCDWSIDVKTVDQAAEMDLSEIETRKAAQNLFSDGVEEEYDEITTLAELPGIDARTVEILNAAGIEDIEKFMNAVEDGSIKSVEGLSDESIAAVNKIINDTVEFIDEDEAPSESGAQEHSDEEEDEEEYSCPECGAKITFGMTKCPACGVEIEFKEDAE